MSTSSACQAIVCFERLNPSCVLECSSGPSSCGVKDDLLTRSQVIPSPTLSFLDIMDRKVRASSFTSSGDESGLDSRKGSMSNNEKDSGVDVTNDWDEFPVLENETMSKIVSVVEWYFSDENLSKDAFMLKHISRNRDGFVSLKLVSSLRKVKSVTKNWKEVAVSINKVSKKLIINESISKVKRVEPLSSNLQLSKNVQSQSKLILVKNVPQDKSNVTSLTSSFTPFGDISLIRVYENSPPPPNTRHLIGESKQAFAILEFESHQAAKDAVNYTNNNSRQQWRSCMEAVFLTDQSTYDVKQRKLVSVKGRKTEEKVTNSHQKLQLSRTLKVAPRVSTGQSPMVKVIRQPIGPDAAGSRGFKRS